MLLKNPDISEKFDVAIFLYYTKLLNLFSRVGNVTKIIRKLFKKSHQKSKNKTSGGGDFGCPILL